MKKYSFASYGLLAEEFKEIIDDKYGDALSCDVFSSKQELIANIKKYNAFGSFASPKGIDLSHLEWLHCFGAGIDAFSHTHLSTGTIFTRTVGLMPKRMGEYCLAHTLAYLKRLDEVKSRKSWRAIANLKLYNQSVIIFGTGQIGSGIGNVFSHLAQKVNGVSRNGKAKQPFKEVFSQNEIKEIDLSKYDIVINALPLTNDTHDYFDAALFNKFNQVFFINVGRGHSVSGPALDKALENGNLAYAVLDVFKQEPLPPSSPWWDNPKITITPHHSGKTDKQDLSISFQKIYECITSGKENDLFVRLGQGY